MIVIIKSWHFLNANLWVNLQKLRYLLKMKYKNSWSTPLTTTGYWVKSSCHPKPGYLWSMSKTWSHKFKNRWFYRQWQFFVVFLNDGKTHNKRKNEDCPYRPCDLLRKYLLLRLKQMKSNWYLIAYRKGKCVGQNVGCHTINSVPKKYS